MTRKLSCDPLHCNFETGLTRGSGGPQTVLIFHPSCRPRASGDPSRRGPVHATTHRDAKARRRPNAYPASGPRTLAWVAALAGTTTRKVRGRSPRRPRRLVPRVRDAIYTPPSGRCPVGGSFNGRTTDSDSVYLGSNPSPPTSLRRYLPAEALAKAGAATARGRATPIPKTPHSLTAPLGRGDRTHAGRATAFGAKTY